MRLPKHRAIGVVTSRSTTLGRAERWNSIVPVVVHWLITSAPRFIKRPSIRIRHRFRYSTGPHGCIFIHIPKSAGLSISQALFGRVGPGHLTIRDYRQAYGSDKLAGFFKFAFVRNPWDRLASAYRFLKAGGITIQDARFARRHLAPFDSFESFVLDWVTPDNVMRYWHFMPQTHFISDERLHPVVDFLGYFENLDADFATVCRRLGVSRKLALLNSTMRKGVSYRSLYTPAMQDIVEHVYKNDIATLGYDFGNTRFSPR